MLRWKIALTFAVTACWLLAASHCQLEQLTGLTFLACETTDADGHSADDCKTEVCCQMEDALYKASNPRITPASGAPVIQSQSIPELAVKLRLAAELSALPSRPFAPPELKATWRFSARAALPPRAPSSVS